MHDVLSLLSCSSVLGVGLDLERRDIHHLLAVTPVRSIPRMMCLHLWMGLGGMARHLQGSVAVDASLFDCSIRCRGIQLAYVTLQGAHHHFVQL